MAKRLNERGYVYILTHPIITAYAKSIKEPDCVKIGYSSNLPYHRAAYLSSSSGIFKSFEVFAFAELDNAFNVEQDLHSLLSNARSDNKREFFYITPEDALKHLRILAKYANGTVYYGNDFMYENENADAEHPHVVVPVDARTSEGTEYWFQSTAAWDVPSMKEGCIDYTNAVGNAGQVPGDYIIGYNNGVISGIARIDQVLSEGEIRELCDVSNWNCSKRSSKYIKFTWIKVFNDLQFKHLPAFKDFVGTLGRTRLTNYPEKLNSIFSILPQDVVTAITA